MEYKAAVITMSDKGSQGLREDTAGDAVVEILKANEWEIAYRTLVPDDPEDIKRELIKCADQLEVPLVITTGGTGFAPRDVTPEVTLEVVDKVTPGIPEAMRAASMKITNRGMLARQAAGIRKSTLIVNLPGSKKAATECLEAVIDPLRHGVEMLLQAKNECASQARVLAICISEEKGTQKHTVDTAELKVDHGIVGDAHAGNWHRQVSMLAAESVAKVQEKIDFKLEAGAFAENILTEGIELFTLPVGTRLQIGRTEGEVTQIGKECHYGCAIRELAGDCVMPREGIFIKVIKPGIIKPGDEINVIS